MGSLKGLKKVLSLFLTTAVVFNLFAVNITKITSSDEVVYADAANDRLKANIALGQSKNFATLNEEDCLNLTEDDLRMLGVFLSNFYIPFNTVLGEGGTPEIEDDIQKQMSEALVSCCGFDTEVAEFLVPVIWQMSLKTAKPLYLGGIDVNNGEVRSLVSETGDGGLYPYDSTDWLALDKGDLGKNVEKADNYEKSDEIKNYPPLLQTKTTSGKNTVKASYYNFLMALSGGVRIGEGDDRTNCQYVTGDFKTTDICLYWENGDDLVPVFDMTNSIRDKNNELYSTDGSVTTYYYQKVSDLSPCQIAYMSLCSDLDYANGYGSSLISVKNYDEFEALTEEDKQTCFIANSQLYVDCFGNIILDYGGSTTILFPACVNPYAWVYTGGVDSSNTEIQTTTGDEQETVEAVEQPTGVSIVDFTIAMKNQIEGMLSTAQSSDLTSEAVAVSLDGTFTPEEIVQARTSINLINQFFISMVENGDAGVNTNSKAIIRSVYKNPTTSSDTYERYTFRVPIKSQSLFNLNAFRVFTGSDALRIDGKNKNKDEIQALLKSERSDGLDYSQSLVLKTDFDFYGGNNFVSFPAMDNAMCYQVEKSTKSPRINTKVYDGVTKDDNGDLEPMHWEEDNKDFANAYLDMYIQPDVSVGSTDFIERHVFADMCIIDNYGLYQTSSTDDVFTTIKNFKIFDTYDEDKNYYKSLFNENYGRTPEFSKIGGDKSKIMTLTGAQQKTYMTSIFLSYLFAYYDTNGSKLSWAYNKDAFPPADTSLIDFSSIEIKSDAMVEEIMSMVYYILHPSEGISYIKTWAKNKLTAILVGIHESIVGRSDGVSTTGSTTYIGFSGYVTIPNLHDLAWTDWLLTEYDGLMVYFIIAMLIILLFYWMLGNLNIQQAITGLIIFSVCAYLPPRFINATVNTSNKICDSIYSSKFTYWALVQHYQYQSELNSALSSGDEQNYLSTIFKNQMVNATDEYSVVTVRWQCPKKENYLVNVRREIEQATGSQSVLFDLIAGGLTNQVSGETYTDKADNTFLYRSYTDIAQYSKTLFNGRLQAFASRGGILADTINVSYTDDLLDYKKSLIANTDFYSGYLSTTGGVTNIYRGVYNYSEAIQYGLLYSPYESLSLSGEEGGTYYSEGYYAGELSKKIVSDGAYHVVAPVMSGTVADAIEKGVTGVITDTNTSLISVSGIDEWIASNTSGIPQSAFNTTIGDINMVISNEDATNNIGNNKDINLFAFAQFTESPYYYFSVNLNDQLTMLRDVTGDTSKGYKDLFLGTNNSYFYAAGGHKNIQNVFMDSYGEMRDFMDMHSLFYVTIPYLKLANNVVTDYDEKYGLFLYEDVPLKYDSDYNLVIPDSFTSGEDGTDYTALVNDTQLYKFMHNVNVAQLFNMYTPWVDLMYASDYAEPEKIKVGNQTYVVQNPLDPYSYCEVNSYGEVTEGRPMVFSRMEMNHYGLEIDDLTKVERNIINMYDKVYEDLLLIMDYYSFGDDVLNTASAMIETFAFNKYFSETKVLGENHVLYPQNFELKNFSYDAYLRLILAETTGEDITKIREDGQSFYGAVCSNSSIVACVAFIILDVLSVYVIPFAKLLFLLLLFFMSITVILAAVVKLEISLPRVLWSSLLRPMASFLLITIGMAWVVSLFMSNGNTAVTQRGGFTISLGDPVIVTILMIVIDCAVLFLYYTNFRGLLYDFIKYFKAVFQSIKGVITGVSLGKVMERFKNTAGEVADNLGLGSTASSRSVANTGAGAGTKVSGGTSAGETETKKQRQHLASLGLRAGAKASVKGAKAISHGAKAVGTGAKNTATGASRLRKEHYNKKVSAYRSKMESYEARKSTLEDIRSRQAEATKRAAEAKTDAARRQAEKEVNKLNNLEQKIQKSIDKEIKHGGVLNTKTVKGYTKALNKGRKQANNGGRTYRRK